MPVQHQSLHQKNSSYPSSEKPRGWQRLASPNLSQLLLLTNPNYCLHQNGSSILLHSRNCYYWLVDSHHLELKRWNRNRYRYSSHKRPELQVPWHYPEPGYFCPLKKCARTYVLALSFLIPCARHFLQPCRCRQTLLWRFYQTNCSGCAVLFQLALSRVAFLPMI